MAVESEALQDTRKIAKTRSWYILNPNLGMGKILAAPISRTSKSGVEIDIGKNFPMYINLEIAHPVNVGKFISYLGVAPDRVRYEVESALSFIYFGKSEDLTSTLTENYNAQRASHMEKDHDTYVYATETNRTTPLMRLHLFVKYAIHQSDINLIFGLCILHTSMRMLPIEHHNRLFRIVPEPIEIIQLPFLQLI